MKLLLDQNISFRLIKLISDIYPEVKQVRDLGLENYTDSEIWDYAKANDYTIVNYKPYESTKPNYSGRTFLNGAFLLPIR